MELGVSHVQNLSSLTPIVDNIFDKYNKNLVPIRSLSDHDISELKFEQNRNKNCNKAEVSTYLVLTCSYFCCVEIQWCRRT